MKTSIIIPIYNSEKYLHRLLDSVINQTYKDIEIILVNDGSTDNSLNICEEFRSRDNRIKICNKTNGGVSSARNEGIEIATGEYITFIDADDYIDKNYIEMLVNNIEGGYLIKIFNNKKLDQKIEKYEFIKQILANEVTGGCWGYLFNKKILDFNNIRFDLNTSYMEDTIFVMEYLMQVESVKLIRENLYHYEAKKGSLTSSKNNVEEKINGYSYSMLKIEKVLKYNQICNEEIQQYIENKKISLIEATFGMIQNKEQVEEIIKNDNVKNIEKQKNIKLKYKLFMKALKSNNTNIIYNYIKFRTFIKKLVKGEIK